MILGVDIGGTAVKLALVERSGEIRHRREASVSFDGYRTPILSTVLQEAQAFTAQAGITPEGVGISATGQIDTETGTVIGTNGKIPGYEGSPLKAAFEQAFQVPACCLNDANAAALGECWRGAGRGADPVIMVTLGTGVGGGIVCGGQVFGGARGIAGELGHFTLYADGIPCACGKRGCYESYAATTALIRLAEAATGEHHLNGRVIFERAAAGEPALCQALRRWTDDIAAGLTGLIHIFNPQLVLIGGGVSAQE